MPRNLNATNPGSIVSTFLDEKNRILRVRKGLCKILTTRVDLDQVSIETPRMTRFSSNGNGQLVDSGIVRTAQQAQAKN